LGKENLPAVSGSADAGSKVNIYTHISDLGAQRFPSVESHSHTDRGIFWPRAGADGSLSRYCSSERVPSPRESGEDPISQRMCDVARVLLYSGAEKPMVLGQDLGVAPSQL
jgi:hypothetical protein